MKAETEKVRDPRSRSACDHHKKEARGRTRKKMSTPTSSSQESADSSPIQPANGKLGIMIPGMGSVATTLVAGVEAVRKGIAKPIGSLTQMGTVRLGKRTDARSPLIKDFVPLAKLDDLCFTGWDIFADNMFEAASVGARARSRPTGNHSPLSRRHPAHAGGLRSVLRQASERHQRQEGQEQARPGGAAAGRYPGL